MKLNTLKNNSSKGFTLIEMIGVLAVIAILAALLIPKVFQAITEARINTVPVGCGTIKTAVIDHYAKYGGLNIVKTTDTTVTEPTTTITLEAAATLADYDGTVLLVEQLIDKPFAPRVGVNPDILLVGASPAATTVDGTTPGVYNLDGLDAGANQAFGSYVVEAVIEDVTAADAQAISARIDGADMSQLETSLETADLQGRVIYAAPASGVTDVRIYLTHR